MGIQAERNEFSAPLTLLSADNQSEANVSADEAESVLCVLAHIAFLTRFFVVSDFD